MAEKTVYRWTRDLHLYFGLFLSPIVVVFALSVIFLVHTWLPWGGRDSSEPATRAATVSLPAAPTELALAQAIQAQLDIPGEVDFINHDEEAGTLSFPITSPGRRSELTTDLSTGRVEIEEQKTGIWDAMIYLHKMPGPHNVSVRGNWLHTRLWGGVADVTVYLLLFLSSTGVYLWTALRAERRAGLICLGAGAATLVLLLAGIVGG